MIVLIIQKKMKQKLLKKKTVLMEMSVMVLMGTVKDFYKYLDSVKMILKKLLMFLLMKLLMLLLMFLLKVKLTVLLIMVLLHVKMTKIVLILLKKKTVNLELLQLKIVMMMTKLLFYLIIPVHHEVVKHYPTHHEVKFSVQTLIKEVITL